MTSRAERIRSHALCSPVTCVAEALREAYNQGFRDGEDFQAGNLSWDDVVNSGPYTDIYGPHIPGAPGNAPLREGRDR